MPHRPPARHRRLCAALGLAAGGLWACADPAPSPRAPLPELGVPLDQGPRTVPVTLLLRDGQGGRPTPGPLRLRVEPLEGGPRQLLDLPQDAAGAWPERIALALPPGPVALVAFADRDGDGLFQGCPFPPSPADPLRADGLDNHFGRFEGRIAAGDEINLTLERRLCGPGAHDTGLEGRILPPPGASPIEAPLYLRLTPIDPEPAGPPLVLPLRPEGLAGPAPFSVGELLPGEYTVELYSDEDGDGLPSPCGPGIGGADRHLTRAAGPVRITAGQRSPLELALQPAEGCAASLTGLSITLELAADLAAQRGAQPVAGLLEGPLWLALVPPSGGPPAVAVTLAAQATRLPQRITVTGLPEGRWRLAAWIDRDGDRQYGPCGGLAEGLDAISGRLEDVSVRTGRLADAGRLTLDLADCDLDRAAVIGTVTLGAEPGSLGSGRPLRLDLVDPRGDRFSVQIAPNHRRLPAEPGGLHRGPFSVAVDVPPDRYRGRIYLDTDQDGTYTSCATQPFGDRATVSADEAPALGALRLGPGALLDLGELTLSNLGCPPPPSGVTVEVILNGDTQPPNRPVRLRIEEQGGFVDDLQILPSLADSAPPWIAPRRALAPGRYQLTAYADSNGNEALDLCDSEDFDTPSARLELNLTPSDPEIDARLLLGPSCPD